MLLRRVGTCDSDGRMMGVSSLKVMVVRAGQISLYRPYDGWSHGINVVLG